MTLAAGPRTLRVFGAGFSLQEPTVESPLPGGVATVVRFVLNLPSWVQITALALGIAAAVVVLALLWRRRAGIRQWVVTRRRGLKIALAAAAAAVVLGFAGFGVGSWRYMQHDNGFCTGCHVMGPAYVRFTKSEHNTLSCHACHQQSMAASMRQLYLWVAERPAEIGPHAKVPNAVCANCHVTGEREIWQRIASTAGHRTHLESHDPALKNVRCVTCHAVEVHHFAPLDKTCAQAGCHDMNKIALGRMRGQTSLHCTTCHRFTAEVPALATRDSAAGTLVPGQGQCFSCHEMRERVAGMNLDPSRDPHRGTCGMCHNPHRQEQPAAARASCTKAGCHDGWRDVPFHVGLRHRTVGEQCTLCHQPHAARVDPSDCAGCHAAVRGRSAAGRRVTPPLPFDTTKALRRISMNPGRQPGGRPGKGGGPFVDDPLEPAPRGGEVATPPDTFPHDRHKSLTCITCHASQRQHGRLTFQPPRGCQICHHEAPAKLDCSRCHTQAELAAPQSVTVRVAVSGAPARAHPARFDHAVHRGSPCTACHAAAVTLAPAAAVASCTACHDGHHAAGRRCAACHATDSEEVREAHAPPERAHLACDACHAAGVVARLVPDRAFCSTCHAERGDHYASRQCTVCHFQMTPETLKPLLAEQGSDST